MTSLIAQQCLPFSSWTFSVLQKCQIQDKSALCVSSRLMRRYGHAAAETVELLSVKNARCDGVVSRSYVLYKIVLGKLL